MGSTSIRPYSQMDVPEAQTLLSSKEQGNKYKILSKIGKGGYSSVFSAVDASNQKYAIKMTHGSAPDTGIAHSTLREIACIKSLSHCNIMELKDVVFMHEACFLVMELCDFDLYQYMNHALKVRMWIPMDEIRFFIFQILDALSYCHERRIIHRDVKPSNCVIRLAPDGTGTLKLTDFGIARVLKTSISRRGQREEASTQSKYTPKNVVTLNYRAPEITLTDELGDYGCPIDVWSAGCVLYELINLEMMVEGSTALECLLKIFRMFGTPTEETWPGVTSMPGFSLQFVDRSEVEQEGVNLTVKQEPVPLFKEREVHAEMRAFVLRMLQLDPSKRITAAEAKQCVLQMV